MGAVRVDDFKGMIPVMDPRLLPTGAAEEAVNVDLGGGPLFGFGLPAQVRTLDDPGALRVYRIPDDPDRIEIGASTWMEFTDRYTDVLRSPVINDAYERYYWTSPTTGPMYNTKARIVAGDPPFRLGVPAPSSAPTVTIVDVGTGDVSETRSYVVTWVTAYGEEGPPSAPVVHTAMNDDIWNIGLTPPTTEEEEDRNLTKANIYRTVTNASGGSSFYFVAQVDIDTTTYPDALSSSEVSANTLLPSTDWVAPPVDLQGWVSMPNGMIAGFKGNTVYFCEPYRPHAWPAGYDTNVGYPIIGLGVFDQSLVVCTNSKPWLMTGINPAAITSSALEQVEPCVSRHSIRGVPGGVLYAGPRGLVLVSTKAENVTRAVISERQWRQEYEPDLITSVIHNSGYTAFRGGGDAKSGFVFDPSESPPKITRLHTPVAIDAAFTDEWTGSTLFISNGTLWVWDPLDATVMFPYRWRSKIFQMEYDQNIAAAKVFFDPVTLPRAGITAWHSEGGLGIDKYGVISVYCDGLLRGARDLTANGQVFKMPSGYKGQQWQFEVLARVRISSIQIASSTRELRDV
jgi:hypothetical protein